MKPTDQQWQAIVNNDQRCDQVFWYGVTTTGIFCRPSCPSRLLKRQNVVVFNRLEEAMTMGFRPCKRCQPANRPVSKQAWVTEINCVLARHYSERLTTRKLADWVHGSPSYLRHVYKELTGITPQQKLTAIRMARAKELLQKTEQPVSNIGQLVGIDNPTYFIHQFKTFNGETPLQYRKRFN